MRRPQWPHSPHLMLRLPSGKWRRPAPRPSRNLQFSTAPSRNPSTIHTPAWWHPSHHRRPRRLSRRLPLPRNNASCWFASVCRLPMVWRRCWECLPPLALCPGCGGWGARWAACREAAAAGGCRCCSAATSTRCWIGWSVPSLPCCAFTLPTPTPRLRWRAFPSACYVALGMAPSWTRRSSSRRRWPNPPRRRCDSG